MREPILIPVTRGMLDDLQNGKEVGWEADHTPIRLQPTFLAETNEDPGQSHTLDLDEGLNTEEF